MVRLTEWLKNWDVALKSIYISEKISIFALIYTKSNRTFFVFFCVLHFLCIFAGAN